MKFLVLNFSLTLIDQRLIVSEIKEKENEVNLINYCYLMEIDSSSFHSKYLYFFFIFIFLHYQGSHRLEST